MLLAAFMPLRAVAYCLIFCLTVYFLMLGPSPSIMRAWLTILLALTATVFERRCASLNLLGIALIAVLLLDPWSAGQIGFQCSFAITAAILLFCQPIDNKFRSIFPSRSLSVTSQWDSFTQHAYVLSGMIRSTLALTVAVNLIALPILIFHFQSFPVFSLIYNLFFPFFVSLSMLVLVLGLCCDWIFPPFGSALHWINAVFTDYVVGLALDSPNAFDISLRFPEISPEIAISIVTGIFALGLFWLGRRQELDIAF